MTPREWVLAAAGAKKGDPVRCVVRRQKHGEALN